jgi:phosphate transport system permease protein
MPEVVVGSTHYSALFMLAFVLMMMVLLVNLIARMVINRTKRKFTGYDPKSTITYRLFGDSERIGSISEKWYSNKGRIIKCGCLALVFVGGWMGASLFFGDIQSLIIAAVVTGVLALLPRLMSNLDPNSRQEIAVCSLMINMVLVIGLLVAIIGYILVNGLPHISVEFLTQFPTDGGAGGGILPAIVGTLELIVGTSVIALPFGVLTGIYLAEYAKDTRLNRLIREAIDILNGTPSVVFGLFGLTFLVISLGLGQSLIAGCLALAFMIVPVIIRTTEEALRTVPNELREASRAIGATKWQTTYKVVLPAAMGGTITGAILAIGRAAGETAPIMFTAAVAYQPELAGSLLEPVMALPYHLYYLSAEVPGATGAQFGTATVLLIIVLGMFVAASLVRNHYNKKIKW